ncbi:MAG TPA: pyridoxal-phosphate dependent enzyme [Acidimicrobiia bacterium]|nr:pyridoxal-phosphate dependent enzyme [Acidimicrobiia bacterium]
MQISDSVVDAIGDTPLVRLSRVHPPGNLVAKLEYMNPGGSVKERIAVAMIDAAEREGLLAQGGTIVEPTSGNTGVGLALVGAVRGYRVICTVPDKVSKEKRDLLSAYGVEVVVTPTELLPDHPDSYYGVARRLAAEIPGAFHPDQYSNSNNPDAHYQTTGPEIWRQTDGQIGVFAAGVGTGGTMTGVSRYLKEQNPQVRTVGVDPEGSIYTAGPDGDIHQYFTEGVGEDFYPETVELDLIDRWEMVDDVDAFAMAHRLARTEGILAGPSGGMAVEGALRVAAEDASALVVVLIPDSGRGYLSKLFNEAWLTEHIVPLSSVPHERSERGKGPPPPKAVG